MSAHSQANGAQRSVAGRLPPHDLAAEVAVLSAVLLGRDASGAEPLARLGALHPFHFYNDANGKIFDAALRVAAAGTPIDIVTVANELRARDALVKVGGSAYLAQVSDESPAVMNVGAHAQIVIAKWRQRQLIATCQRIAAEGYGDVGELDRWLEDAHAEIGRIVAPAANATTPVEAAWGPTPLSYVTVAPPARRWLLRHPTRDGAPAPPGHGDGLLPLGKTGGLVADSGVGKTMALFGLAIAVVTGKRWLGHFDVSHEARGRRVLLGLAEEDAEEAHRRSFGSAQAFDLDADERRLVAERVVILPLAGRAVPLLVQSERGLVDSPDLVALRRRLRDDAGDWALVVLDPFSRWAGPEAEVDNAAATRTIQAAESLAEAPGGPTVLLAHHAPQSAVSTGAIRGRGVTGIRAALRWEATLTAEAGDVYFVQSKSNYSRPMREDERLRLVRGPGGLLRAATEAEEAEREAAREARQDDRLVERERARDARYAARLAALVDRIVAAASAQPQSKSELGAAAAIGRREDVVSAVLAAVTAGRLVVAEPARGHDRYTLPGVRT